MKKTLLILLLTSCVGDDVPVAEATLAGRYLNGRYLNGRYLNGRYLNGRYLNGRYLNGRYLNGLDVSDPAARELAEYVVSCALPAGEEAVVGGVAFAGAVGLAPEWAEGACGDACARWLSACLLARVNARGEHVEISMRGPHPALHPVPGELAEFTQEEGTYFGDLFASPEASWASSARDDLELPRTCGDTIEACFVDVVGASADVCRGASRAQGRKECTGGDGHTFAETITVFLR